MNPSRILAALRALVVVPLLLTAGQARAADSGVRDQAGFFSESARSSATRTLAEIERTLKKEVRIETYAEVPADRRQGVDLQDKAAVRRLFESWSTERARELGINGIYVVLTREPAHLQVAVGNETQKGAFTLADRDALVERMLRSLRARKNDEALIGGVNFVQETLRSHLAAGGRSSSASERSASSPSSSSAAAQPVRSSGGEGSGRGLSWMGLLLPILVIGLGIMVVARLIGRLLGRGSLGGTPPVLGGGGGGGFMRSLMGGLFGAAAGMWLYNMFSGSHTSAWGSDNPPGAGGGEGGFSGRDSDYSSSGGDFGDSSGGGDFGGGFGGDGGGGDF